MESHWVQKIIKEKQYIDKFVARNKKYSPRHYRFQQDGHKFKFLDFLFPFWDKILFHKRMGVTIGSEVVSQNQSPFK